MATWTILLIGAAAAQSCPEASSVGQLQLQLEAAEFAFADRDREGFEGYVAAAAGLLPCLSDALSPSVAGRVHRVEGLAAWLATDTDAAALSFAAARAAEPGFRLPTDLVPTGHPAQLLYDQASAPEDAIDLAPAAGRLHFEGRESLARPAARPTVMQVFDATGEVAWTGRLLPADPTPDYPLAPAPIADAAPLPEPAGPRLDPRVKIAGAGLAAGGGLLLGAGLTGLSFDTRQSADPWDPGLEQLASTHNALVIAGYSTVAVSAGVGAWGLLSGDR